MLFVFFCDFGDFWRGEFGIREGESPTQKIPGIDTGQRQDRHVDLQVVGLQSFECRSKLCLAKAENTTQVYYIVFPT